MAHRCYRMLVVGCLASGIWACSSSQSPALPQQHQSAPRHRPVTPSHKARVDAKSMDPRHPNRGVRAFMSRLSTAINRAARRGPRFALRMRSVAKFDWRRLHVFISGPRSLIQHRLGFKWALAPDDVPTGSTLLVFTAHKFVALAAFFPSRRGDFECEATLSGLTPQRAQFFVRRSSRTYANPRATILIAHRRADAHERKCLAVFGAS